MQNIYQNKFRTDAKKLAHEAYSIENTYLYKGKEPIAPLEMVDNILVPVKCGQDSIKMNSKVNAFIESKKLTLSSKKCHKMHLGKKSLTCPNLKVHEQNMEDTEQEKYLGDILMSSGKLTKTVEDRQAKGFGSISQILAILAEIPLGKHRI